MFPIPNCSRSMGIQLLLVIAFGITQYPSPASSIGLPANGSCQNFHGEMECYFKGSTGNETMNWDNARQLCSSLNSTLPVIRNEHDQVAVADYLKSHMYNSEVWTSGREFTYSSWTWINGDSLKNSVKVTLQEIDGNQYGALDEKFIFTAQAAAAAQKWPYICQYQSAYCNSATDNAIKMTGKCLRLNDESRSWYDARNQCLTTKGDLAVIGDAEFEFLETLKLNQSYWIGLRKKSFRWTLNDDDVESNDEIKYTNWGSHTYAAYGECIFIIPSEGKWKAIGCDGLGTVVCQRRQGVTSTVTTEASAETIDTFTLFAVVGVGIVIVICIIVIVVFVLRTRNGRSGQSKLDDGYVKNNREELVTRISNVPAYTSINEPAGVPVNGSDDIRGVYADIPLLTSEQSDDGGINQQPGIVYASLDFNKDPTNLEPNQSLAHSTSSPTKVGPLGDIYAIPDAKGHAVTSPCDKSASHPVKVTPQGDVYAIPMKISTSPTVKPPIGAVYANLPTATLDKEPMAVDYDETK